MIDRQAEEILNWCRQAVGPVEIVTDHSRAHAGQRAGVYRLRCPAGFCYVKMHRDPELNWISQPELAETFLDGYGRSFSLEEEKQRLVAHVQYALAAVVWGMESEYFGFAAEGRQALKHLAERLR